MDLLSRLNAPAPKRILSLDGGGIRGALSLGILESMEHELRTQHENEALLLSDYFDLIIGTSTGAIIAGGLAIGLSVAEIRELYLELGGKVFAKRGIFNINRLKASFDAEKLRGELKTIFGDIKMGSDQIKTGLCVVTKRVETGSTWPVINHPNGKFFDRNSTMLLRDVIRASTAAPTYFEPEVIDVGMGEIGAFVDGGVSMANNPSLRAFLIATLSGFPFRWKTGGSNLLLHSVGTGVWQDRKPVDDVANNKIWNWASEVPAMLMGGRKLAKPVITSGDLKMPDTSYYRHGSWPCLGRFGGSQPVANICSVRVAFRKKLSQ